MARTQSENYPEIRQGILDRSAALFARRGYPNTTIADLAAANGISRGLLYHYFASKEALLSEMLHAHLDLLLGAIRRSAKDGATPEERLRNSVRKMVSINAGSKDLQIVLLHDLQNLEPGDRDAIVGKQKEILAVVAGLIRDCDHRRKYDDRQMKAQTMMFMGMINYTYLWYDPKGPVGPAEYADMVADTYLAGLGA
jgi:AcrR family transcriptional regulator